MMDKVHILKAFEGHGQNQSFDVLVGISAPGENTGAFLCDFSLLHALLIEGRELLHDVFNPGLSTVIHVVKERQDEDGLVGVAHGHGGHSEHWDRSPDFR